MPNGSWFLLHDNARKHTSLIVKEYLAQKGVVELNHPPYTPDLSPPDYFLFHKIKSNLKGKRFQDIDDIQKNVTAELVRVTQADFHKCFKQLYERSRKCVASVGMYFEKY